MKWWWIPIGIAVALLVGVLGLAVQWKTEQDAAMRLQRQVGDLLQTWRSEHRVAGVTLGVDSPRHGRIVLASGVADLARGTPLRADHRFHIGSVTKTFVAAAVLRLAQERRLELDEPALRYLPDLPLDDRLTVRHLLANRSGILDYQRVPGFYETVGMELGRRWSPEQVVALALAEPGSSAPGEAFEYSSTNFLLLGMLVERVSGTSLSEVLRTQFLEPLDLQDTSLEADASSTERLATGYSRTYADLWGKTVVASDEVSTTAIHSISWASGAMLSTVPDLLRWTRALYSPDGQALSSELRRQMLTFDPALGPYGLGVYAFDGPGERSVGHGGLYLGYLAAVRYLPRSDISLVALANGDAVELNGLLNQVEALLLGVERGPDLDALVRQLGDRARPATEREAAALELGKVALRHGPPGDATQFRRVVYVLIFSLQQDRDPSVRGAAALALGSYGRAEPEAEAALRAALDDPNEGVKNAATQALRVLGGA